MKLLGETRLAQFESVELLASSQSKNRMFENGSSCLEERRREHWLRRGPVAIAGHHEVEIIHRVSGIEAGDLHIQNIAVAGAVIDNNRAGGHAVRDGDRSGELADIGKGNGGGAGIAELVVPSG